MKSLAELKGKRIRATGGGAEMFKLAGAVPIGATLTEAVSLLQRGGMDCQFGCIHGLPVFCRRRQNVQCVEFFIL